MAITQGKNDLNIQNDEIRQDRDPLLVGVDCEIMIGGANKKKKVMEDSEIIDRVKQLQQRHAAPSSTILICLITPTSQYLLSNRVRIKAIEEMFNVQGWKVLTIDFEADNGYRIREYVDDNIRFD